MIPTRSKVFQVLLYLLEERHRVVSKAELMAHVWPEQYVSDETIGTCITEVRQAVGDSGQQQHTIQTRRGRGYRFIAAVETTSLPETEPSPPPEPVVSARPLPKVALPSSERRHFTVLCCDVVDAFGLSQQLDAEEFADLVKRYRAACVEVIDRYGGHVADERGTELLVYFGYPWAYEDAAQRAVRTSWDLVQEVGQSQALAILSSHITWGLQLGVATGMVVMDTLDDGGTRELSALGETPNRAIRLHSLAAPNTVVMSGETFNLVRDVFECHALNVAPSPAGYPASGLYRVDRPRAVKSRFDIMVRRGLTPFIGRTQELAILQERWRQAQTGHGQVVILSGEAGIGKSRLIQVFKNRLDAQPHRLLECQGSPYHQFTGFYPIIDLFTRLCDISAADSPAMQLSKLEHTLVLDELWRSRVVPFLAPLLGISLPQERYPTPNITLQQQRQRTLAAILEVLRHLAVQQPTLCIVEDIHWIDPSTLELLTLLVNQGPTTPLLTVLVCRPEFQPPWGQRAHVTSMTLQHLSPEQSQQMVAAVAADRSLADVVQRHIVNRTDGVPLFIEELTKTLLEAEDLDASVTSDKAVSGAERPIPETLHDALMARLDRLDRAKQVAQFGAVIGRQFSHALLQATTTLDAASLQSALNRLVEAELLYQQGTPPEAIYVFKHALIQDVAYGSLLKRTRQHDHEHIATVLEAQFPDIVAQQPEIIAHHYKMAGLNDPAVAYWHKAGRRAIAHSAHAEAIAFLREALACLKTLPDTTECRQQELDIQIDLGMALQTTKSFAALEAEQAYIRARSLCQQSGETARLFPVLLGLWRVALSNARIHTARELGAECLSLAQRHADPTRLMWGHWALGHSLFFLGELASARVHLAQAADLYDPQQNRSSSVTDPGTTCLSFLAMTLWFLGYPNQAFALSREALRHAQELDDPFRLITALNWSCIVHHLHRDMPTIQSLAEKAIALCIKHAFASRLCVGHIHLGWALAAQ